VAIDAGIIRRAAMTDECWLVADEADIRSVRAMLDTNRLRVRLLLLVSGTGAQFNLSRIARELGCGRKYVARLIAEERAQLRGRRGLLGEGIFANNGVSEHPKIHKRSTREGARELALS
jgi:hypothetical protein